MRQGAERKRKGIEWESADGGGQKGGGDREEEGRRGQRGGGGREKENVTFRNLFFERTFA